MICSVPEDEASDGLQVEVAHHELEHLMACFSRDYTEKGTFYTLVSFCAFSIIKEYILDAFNTNIAIVKLSLHQYALK